MTKGAALGAAFVTAALVLTARASADPGPGVPAASDAEAVSLLYEDSPPPDCPTEAEFEAEVVKLTSKAHFTKERRARRVRIELSSVGRDVMGRLVSGDGKNQSSRELRGKTCREVASALAIAVALTIDPEALLGPTEPDPKPAGPPTPPPEPKPPEPKPPEPKPPAAKPVAPEAPARPVAAPPAPPPSRLHVGLGVGVVLEGAWSPRMSPGGKLVGAVVPNDRLRIALGVTRFITREVDDVSFGAWLVDGAVSYNVLVLGAFRPFVGLGYEFGMIQASGSGLPETVNAERPWQAGSAGVGIRFETDGFFLQAGGSLVVPFSRQRYLVSDPLGKVRTLYEVPDLGLKQETTLGVFL